MKIDSRVAVVGRVTYPDASVPSIKNEPMLFNCDYESAYRLGSYITRRFLDALPNEWQAVPLVIDSRVHMLMPGWYPCIPGWHHDDVPRTRSDGQPNYGPGQMRSQHIMMLINGEICPTEFAVGEADFEVPGMGRTIYEDWHRDVEALVKNKVLKVQQARSGELLQFDDRTWHRGVQALDNGWRFFIRASRYFTAGGDAAERGNPRTNEVRRQVQVYLEDPNKGW